MNLLARHSDVQLVALFAPEHGILGQAQAGGKVCQLRKRVQPLWRNPRTHG